MASQNQVQAALSRKLGPLPAWAWAGLGAVGLYVYRQRQAAAAATGTGTSSTATGAQTPAYVGPYGEGAYGGGGGFGGGGAFGGGGNGAGMPPSTSSGISSPGTPPPAITVNLPPAPSPTPNPTPSAPGPATSTKVKPRTASVKPGTLLGGGAIEAASGPKKPAARAGYTTVGLGGGRWEYKPIVKKAPVRTAATTHPGTRAAKPKATPKPPPKKAPVKKR